MARQTLLRTTAIDSEPLQWDFTGGHRDCTQVLNTAWASGKLLPRSRMGVSVDSKLPRGNIRSKGDGDQQSVCWIDIIWEMVEDKGPDQGWGLWLTWLTRVLIKTSTRKCIEVPRISNFSFVLKLFHYSISWRYEKALVVFITESLTLSNHRTWNCRTVYQHYHIAWIFNPLA